MVPVSGGSLSKLSRGINYLIGSLCEYVPKVGVGNFSRAYVKYKLVEKVSYLDGI